MKRIMLLPAALVLAGCAFPSPRQPEKGTLQPPLSSGPVAATAAQQPSTDPLAAPARRELGAAVPVTAAGVDRFEFRLPVARGRSFAPALFLSPEGSRLAYTYETGRAADETLAAIEVLPLAPVPGRARVVAWAPEPGRDARSSPGLRLVGWLDEHRLVALRALPTGDELWASSALRVEVLDTVDDTVQIGPWFGMGRSRWNLQQIQVWLTAARHELVVNTADLWRIDLPSGQPTRIKPALPSLGDEGPLVAADLVGQLALSGGGADHVVRGLIDLRSGREYPLRPEWQTAAFGPGRRLAVLANQPGKPGAEIPAGSGIRSLYSTALILRADGSPEGVVEPPLGWLLEEAVFTPDGGALLLTGVQVTPDPTNLRTKNRLSRRALFSAPLDGHPPVLLWEGPKENLAAPSWTLSGRWLLIGDRQVALADGQSLPLPAGVSGQPLAGPPDGLIGWQKDGTLVRFVVGHEESVAIGKPATAADAAGLRAQMAGGWLLLQSEIGDTAVRVEVLRLR